MNKELIKEFANQAIENISNKKILKDGQVEQTWSPDQFNEVFAELIVQECVRILNIWSDEKPCSEGYDIGTVYRIKERFKLNNE